MNPLKSTGVAQMTSIAELVGKRLERAELPCTCPADAECTEDQWNLVLDCLHVDRSWDDLPDTAATIPKLARALGASSEMDDSACNGYILQRLQNIKEMLAQKGSIRHATFEGTKSSHIMFAQQVPSADGATRASVCLP